MPRFYVRTTTRGSWTEENVTQALLAFEDGQALSTCAKEYNVPRNTLRRHWQKRLKKAPGSNHLGRDSILCPAIQTELVDYILMLEDKGFGLTPTDVRELTFEYAKRNNIRHTFDRNLKMAGRDWWAGFRVRHREMLSIRKPQGLSLYRAASMNRPAVAKYFNILEREMRRLGISDKPNCSLSTIATKVGLVSSQTHRRLSDERTRKTFTRCLIAY